MQTTVNFLGTQYSDMQQHPYWYGHHKASFLAVSRCSVDVG